MPRDCGYCAVQISGCYRGHLDENHQRIFVCGYEACFSKQTRFRGQQDLHQHQSETTKHLSRSSGMVIKTCKVCSRRFKGENAVKQHQTDKHGPNVLENQGKPRTVNDGNALKQHQTDKHGPNVLKNQEQSTESRTVKDINSPKESTELQGKLHEYYKTVHPTKEDRIKSRELIRDTILKPLLDGVNADKERLYNGSLEKAGSAATNTKVNKADEFDFDLHLNIKDIKLDKSDIDYKLSIRAGISPDVRSLEEEKSVTTGNVKALPDGYIQLKSESAPGRLKVGEYIVPRLVHEDLYKKLKEHVSKIKHLSIQRKPHGPAITLTYHKPGEHHIDIDLSPSLYTKDYQVDQKVWERDFLTKNPRVNQGPSKLVDKLKDVPVLLVPKKEDCWLISHEKVMKTMVNSMDGPGTCRKESHKVLKGDVLKWKSKESFEGMSTNPLKHHLLWFNDKHPDDQYWASENLATCYADMLVDLEGKMRQGNVPNYFDDGTNLLEGKDRGMLNRFADRLKERREEYLK